MRLKDKVVLIIGGAAGIGKAIAKLFKEEGAKVIICDVNEEKGLQTSEEVGCFSSRVEVSARKEVQDWVEEVTERYNRIDGGLVVGT